MHTPDILEKPTRATSLRIGIQGRPKTGKTWSALTFPNPVVLDVDKNIPPGHPVYDKVLTIPLWNLDTCRKLTRTTGKPDKDVPRHEALKNFIEDEGSKFTPEQTLIWDSATYIGNFIDSWFELHPVYTKQGRIDDFYPWKAKINYFTQLHDLIFNLKCNFVCIIHEQWDYKDGEVVGVKPALTGAFGDVIAGRYNEWFQQAVVEHKQTKERTYWWKVKSTDTTNAGGSLISLLPPNVNAIEANYNKLIELLKSHEQTN